MCGRAGLGLSVAHLRARWGGLHPGAQSDHAGPHGPTPLPAGAAGSAAQSTVTQRVSPPAACVSLGSKAVYSTCFLICNIAMHEFGVDFKENVHSQGEPFKRLRAL